MSSTPARRSQMRSSPGVASPAPGASGPEALESGAPIHGEAVVAAEETKTRQSGDRSRKSGSSAAPLQSPARVSCEKQSIPTEETLSTDKRAERSKRAVKHGLEAELPPSTADIASAESPAAAAAPIASPEHKKPRVGRPPKAEVLVESVSPSKSGDTSEPRVSSRSRSRYNGVTELASGKFRAQIFAAGALIPLGEFDDELKAARYGLTACHGCTVRIL